MHPKSWTDFWRCISLASVFFYREERFSACNGQPKYRSAFQWSPSESGSPQINEKYFPQGAEAAAFYCPLCSFLPLLILPARPLAEYTFG